MQEIFAMMMQHPLGVVAITIMAPVVEELLFRGAIQGHLLRKWKKPLWYRCIVTDIRYRTWQLGTSSFRFRGRSYFRLDLLSYR